MIMTAQIPFSQIGNADEFKKRVEAFRQAKLDHHATVGEPAPREHELVEAAVRRVPRGLSGIARSSAAGEGAADFAARSAATDQGPGDRAMQENAADDYAIDYEIVDDRPSLRARKDALIHEVTLKEHALLTASMPPGKRRLDGLKAGDLLRTPQAERSEAERQFLAERDARHAREDAIQRHAAQLMSDIEDLTEATIGAWQPAPFPDPGPVFR
jgi:hypothetical protein